MMDSEGLYKAIQESLTVDPAFKLEAGQLAALHEIVRLLSEKQNVAAARAAMSPAAGDLFPVSMPGGARKPRRRPDLYGSRPAH